MKPSMLTVSTVAVAAVFLLGAVSAPAQSIFLEPNNMGSIHLEALRPGFGGVNLSNLSFALFLSGRVQVGETLQIRGDFPYMTYKVEPTDYYWGQSSGSEGKNAIGNPYVGLDVGSPDRGTQGEFGIRLPVVQDTSGAEREGAATDPVERMEAFLPDILPVFLGVNYRHRSSNGFAMRFRFVPVFWFYVGNSSSDTDLFLLYSAQAWYETEKVGVGGGFSGRAIATGDEDGFGERSIHQFGFFANYAFGSFLPGFQIRIPLDQDLKDNMVPAYSISLGIKL